MRFGLFIHFGLYSKPGGIYKNDTVPVGGIAEHLIRLFEIPVTEYRKLASDFNPHLFSAEEIVSMAKDAGMQYIVFTTKHLEGFSMFDSDYSTYDIVDATPYGKDILKELSDACLAEGIKLGLYYSQSRDCNEYHSVDPYGNNWDWDEGDSARNLQVYLDTKVKPQLKELLTNYGDILCIWFDTPGYITEKQSEEIYDLVKKLQPECLVNSRLGNGVGDYGVLGDNQIPPAVLKGAWECPATMNHTWGYHQLDTLWKSPEHLLGQLADLSSKNVNFLLNIGPKGDGSIPMESIKRLEEIGAWMKINGEAILGTTCSPWFQENSSCMITRKGSVMYLILSEPKDTLKLFNLKTEIASIQHLRTGRVLSFKQVKTMNPEIEVLSIDIPEFLKKEVFPVFKIILKEEPVVRDIPTQVNGKDLLMQAGLAAVNPGEGSLMIAGMHSSFNIGEWPYYATKNWNSEEDWLEWEVTLLDTGSFDVEIVNVSHSRFMEQHRRHWANVYKTPEDLNIVCFEIGESRTCGKIQSDERIHSRRSSHRPEFLNVLGNVNIHKPGAYTARLKAGSINNQDSLGLIIYEVRLRKRKSSE